MRLALLVVVALAGRTALAGTMVIATAATPGLLNGFCVQDPPDGRFKQPTPRRTVQLARANPRKILFVPETRAGRGAAGTLYVAEPDRVEAFRIGDDGAFGRCGTGDAATGACRAHTRIDDVARPMGLAVSDDHTRLYVSERRIDRLTAFRLDDDGLPVDADGQPIGDGPKDTFTSCIQGRTSSAYADVLVNDRQVYVAASAGRVEVYRTLDTGDFCTGSPCAAILPSACPSRQKNGSTPTVTTPFLERRALSNPTSLFVVDGLLYVQETALKQLSAFRIADLQPLTFCTGGTNAGVACTLDTDCPCTDCPATGCPTQAVCSGGATAGVACTTASDCPGGSCICPESTCAAPTVCDAGKNAGQSCTVASDCPGSSCLRQRVCTGGADVGHACTQKTEASDCPDSHCRRVAPGRATRTNHLDRHYATVVHAGPAFLGSVFVRGRIDAFFLRAPGSGKTRCTLTACEPGATQCCLPREASARTDEDVRMSPVGLAVAPTPDHPESSAPAPGDQVLYVAGGDLDRVRVFRLNPNGGFKSRTFIDQTDDQKG